jgi:hypothetical protein
MAAACCSVFGFVNCCGMLACSSTSTSPFCTSARRYRISWDADADSAELPQPLPVHAATRSWMSACWVLDGTLFSILHDEAYCSLFSNHAMSYSAQMQ